MVHDGGDELQNNFRFTQQKLLHNDAIKAKLQPGAVTVPLYPCCGRG